jgi:prepilin peptidase CpaA
MSDPFGVYADALLLAAAGVTLTYAALSDIATREIPNWASLSVLSCGVVLRLADNQIWLSLASAIAVFVFAVILWRLGALGGGDVKLLAAASTLIPFPQSINFLPMVALCGGALAVVHILLSKTAPAWCHTAWAATIARKFPAAGQRSLPYGTAIAAGAFASLAWR